MLDAYDIRIIIFISVKDQSLFVGNTAEYKASFLWMTGYTNESFDNYIKGGWDIILLSGH